MFLPSLLDSGPPKKSKVTSNVELGVHQEAPQKFHHSRIREDSICMWGCEDLYRDDVALMLMSHLILLPPLMLTSHRMFVRTRLRSASIHCQRGCFTSISHTHSLAHTHTHTHTYIHTHIHSLAHTHAHSLSNTHSHTHTSQLADSRQ